MSLRLRERCPNASYVVGGFVPREAWILKPRPCACAPNGQNRADGGPERVDRSRSLSQGARYPGGSRRSLTSSLGGPLEEQGVLRAMGEYGMFRLAAGRHYSRLAG